jgi:Domain of unknown function (DUF4249)
MKNILFILVMSCLLMSCDALSTIEEREVFSVKTPSVQIFLCPQDTVITAKVYGTNPTVGTGSKISNPIVSNATIILTNEMNQRIELKWNKALLNYSSSAKGFDVIVGKRYDMKLKTPEGDNLTAFCIIPQQIELQGIRLIKTKVEPSPFNDGTEYFIQWRDFTNQKNYYSVFILNYFESFSPKDIRLEGEGTMYGIEDDKLNNGEVVSPKSWLLRARQTGSNGAFQYARYQTLLVCHTDENYAKFHKSLEEIKRNNDNPFAEPSRLYTNVKGGFGVFAGYNRTEYKVDKLP